MGSKGGRGRKTCGKKVVSVRDEKVIAGPRLILEDIKRRGSLKDIGMISHSVSHPKDIDTQPVSLDASEADQ